ncbi:MAG: AMP-binding protein [Hyphomicrobiaceae bacterium]|nr:MAG: AMP-binding protein [Hyphomicrobiaceae bacterium]
MKLDGATYDEVTSRFAWDIPAKFNIARAISGRHAAATPEATALTFEAADGELSHWSFRRVEECASRLANGLSALGVGKGVIVGIGLPQSPETLISHIAVQKLGAIALPLFALFGPDAVAYRLADSGAPVLITGAEALERARAEIDAIATLRHRLIVRSAGGKLALGRDEHEFWSFLERGAGELETAQSLAEDPALLIYTSGTTGNPKGVLHAGRVLLGHLPGVALPQDLFPQPGDRFWTPADWAWAGGLLDVLMPSLYHGVTVVGSARAKFDPEWAFELMARHGVRNVFMPPTALRLMRQVQEPRHFGCRLRSIGTGGERLGEDMIAWGRDTFGLTMNEFFGQTEVNLVVGNSATLFPVRPGSMGRAIPGHRVEIVDNDGHVLPAGKTGIVAVRRPDPVMFLEYWRKPEATAEKFRGDWCLLGDVASKDEDGYFWYQGRDDDIISSAAYRIGPGEVEECLMKHPAVALAGVIGSPDPIRGEVVAAFIVPRQGVTPSRELAADIQTFVKQRLAAHEYPRKIRFIKEMPMTVTGKVRRVDLRKMDAESPD